MKNKNTITVGQTPKMEGINLWLIVVHDRYLLHK